ncbi:MAG: hypothetical protein K8F52_18185 [Candidatus Scalindua rubra]|uniref:Uncharacterized protein n=1 Tax=Candidatus Scalindua brodae TaxID=237368 RepID=A0A0B0EE60_9BACT|nr:MAG: hypothetical protein SCABRO_02820 [Candidatus Scalindua brodae]MBZ0110585.1 hypothetical protein [Candidatus Scalindua rubra]TWU35386.1 hypothetical protein S225a_07440 [Candidatus Brocadiaceae bacterium S225]
MQYGSYTNKNISCVTFEFTDVIVAPIYNAGLLGAFGGYIGGSGDWTDVPTAMDWSIGNTVPLSLTRTDNMVFSTNTGSWLNPLDWKERLRITKDGNVGIGTTSPISLLDLVSDSHTTITLSTYSSTATDDKARVNLRRARGTMAVPSALLSGDDIGAIFSFGYGTNGWGNEGTGINFVAAENWTDTAHGSYLSFETIANGTDTSRTVMKIDQSGNVGIGTKAPETMLHIASNTNSELTISNHTVSEGSAFIGRRTQGTMSAPGAVLEGDTLVSFEGQGWGVTGLAADTSGMNVEAEENFTDLAQGTRITFTTVANETTGQVERMRIDNAGNVGIGTNSPKAKLDVWGGIKITPCSTCMGSCSSAEDAGKIWFDSNSNHFYGCVGDGGWKQLDM